MTGRRKRKHEAQHRFAGYPMVNDDGPFVSTGSVTNTAAVAITFQNCFPETAKVLFVLSFQRAAGRTKPKARTFALPQGQ